MTRRQKYFTAIIPTTLIVIAVLLAGAYLGRGWIRASAIPAYVRVFYWPGVERNFENDFTPVNDKLKSYGTNFNVIYASCRKGGNVSFQGISESVPCIKQQQSDFTLSNAFISRWKLEAPAFERYLLSNGWQKQYDTRQSISTLFNRPMSDGGISVHYAKLHGNTFCNLTIAYTTYVTMANPTVPQHGGFVEESCARSVSFFGGFNG